MKITSTNKNIPVTAITMALDSMRIDFRNQGILSYPENPDTNFNAVCEIEFADTREISALIEMLTQFRRNVDPYFGDWRIVR